MNFDTAIGAAITSLFIANIIDSVIPPVATIALLIAVLAIYNFDHLLDAKKISGIAISGRHRFYQQNFARLSIYQLILLLFLLVISWFLPANIARAGIMLSVVTLIYFLLLFIILPQRFALKELMIAMVFASGIFLSPVSFNPSQTFSIPIILLWVEIFLLALANTLILSWFDYMDDKKEGQTSLAQIIGDRAVRTIGFITLAVLLLIIILSLAIDSFWADQLVILIMGLVLFVSLIIGKKIELQDGLRVAGETIFLIPLLRLIL
ncbi:MAG: hypothetical protein DRI71_05715 [Bacteroidetes bacterium]|nr:MAG: hypothetical protein DRI71_05715 [Bacteroidota bacterium]